MLQKGLFEPWQRGFQLCILGMFLVCFTFPVHSQAQVAEPVPGSLAGTVPPEVVERISGETLEGADGSGVAFFIKDKQKAIELGKALFWDQAAGSDGQACASCHFNAGMDNRIKNQLNPGINGGNGTFDATQTGAGGPNYTLKKGDYPFHKLANHRDRDSAVVFNTDDVTSSQGVYPSIFSSVDAGLPSPIDLGNPTELCDVDGPPDPLGFHVGGTNVRRVEPRNTPTVINAALNHRNFWDGRANNIFNGQDPFGRRNEAARILEVDTSPEGYGQRQVEFTNSSLASQAVGPPGSPFEMSCAGRLFPHIGKKMLSLTPLAGQVAAPTDSVLGSLALPGGGLSTTYQAMVEAAFANKFWDSSVVVDINQDPVLVGDVVPGDLNQFTLTEANWSFFWGLAVQLYQATLISDDSRFDRGPLRRSALAGFNIFLGQGGCVNCHATAMFTKASTLHLVDEAAEEGLVERMLMGDEGHLYSVNGDGSVGNFDVDVQRASGSPTALGSAATGTNAGGTVTVTETPGSTCEYDVNSFNLLDPDTNNSEQTVSIAGDSTDLSCDPVEITITENPAGADTIIILVDSIEVANGSLTSGDFKIMEPAVYDNGFYNIGVTPTAEDKGVGGVGPFGHPLSFSRQYVEKLRGNDVPDPFEINECTFEIRFNPDVDKFFFPAGFITPPRDCGVDEHGVDQGVAHRPVNPKTIVGDPVLAAAQDLAIQNMRVAVDGAHKVATLRNVELSGPFFHNGGAASLKQVIRFYNRGGNFDNRPNMDPDIHALGLTNRQIRQLEIFLVSLTDRRVKCEKAPFDHPQLFVSHGHPGDETGVTESAKAGQATQTTVVIPAVGAAGLPAANCLKPFDRLLPN